MGCLWKWGGFRTSIAIYIMGTMLINHGILASFDCLQDEGWRLGLGGACLHLHSRGHSESGFHCGGLNWVWNEGQIALREISKKSGVISYPLDSFFFSMENGIVWWCSCWWEGVTAKIQRRHCDSDSYLHARTRGFTVSSMLKNARPSKEGFSCFAFWKAFHFRHHFFTSRNHPTTAPLPRCCRSLWPRCMQPWHLWPGINHPKLLQLLNHQDAPGLFCLVKKPRLLYNSL